MGEKLDWTAKITFHSTIFFIIYHKTFLDVTLLLRVFFNVFFNISIINEIFSLLVFAVKTICSHFIFYQPGTLRWFMDIHLT